MAAVSSTETVDKHAHTFNLIQGGTNLKRSECNYMFPEPFK